MSNQPPHWPHGTPQSGSGYGHDPYGRPQQPPPPQQQSPFRALGPVGAESSQPQPAPPPSAAQAPYGTFSQPYVSKQFDPAAEPTDAYRQPDPHSTPPPQASFGTPPPASVSIDDFGPRRDRRPLIIVGLTALVVVAAIVAAIVVSSRPPATPAASATPTGPTPTKPAHTPNPNGQGVQFTSTNDHADGYWEIKQQTWGAQGVLIQLSVAVDDGSFVPVFFVFNNDTNAQYRVDLSAAPAPTFPRGTLSAPQTYTGQIYVAMPHVEGTLIMVSAQQTEPISALPIKS